MNLNFVYSKGGNANGEECLKTQLRGKTNRATVKYLIQEVVVVKMMR